MPYASCPWKGYPAGSRFKSTLPRQMLYEILSSAPECMTAEEIFGSLKNLLPGAGLATVYRTLNLLVKLGQVTRIDIGDGRSRFELSESITHEHRHHLVCTSCGKVIRYADFPQEERVLMEKTEMTLVKKYGFTIERHSIVFYGLCPRCVKPATTGG
jgi:Fur family ferric uptake transcriptional regulator